MGSNKSNPYLHCTEINMDWDDLCLNLHVEGNNESNPYLHCAEMNMDWNNLPVSKPSR